MGKNRPNYTDSNESLFIESERPLTTTLFKPSFSVETQDKFLDRSDIFISNSEINFKSKKAIVKISGYGNFYASNLKDRYSESVKFFEVLGLELIVDLGYSYYTELKYIAEKREGYQDYLDFLKDISKKHQFFYVSPEKEGDNFFYFIDSEKIDSNLEEVKELNKINNFYGDLSDFILPSKPRLKIYELDEPELNLNGRGISRLNNLEKSKIEKMFSYMPKKLKGNLYSDGLYGPNKFFIVSELEKAGCTFLKNQDYLKTVKLNILNEIGD